MCTNKSTNKQRVDFACETKRAFSFNFEIGIMLYVCTLSGLEEWGLVFNKNGTCSFNQI